MSGCVILSWTLIFVYEDATQTADSTLLTTHFDQGRGHNGREAVADSLQDGFIVFLRYTSRLIIAFLICMAAFFTNHLPMFYSDPIQKASEIPVFI